VRSREAYDLVASYMKSEGRLQPGVAPRAEAALDPGPAPIEDVNGAGPWPSTLERDR
jgi:hypothetical protein